MKRSLFVRRRLSNHRVLVVVALWCVSVEAWAQGKAPVVGDIVPLLDGGTERLQRASPSLRAETPPPEQPDRVFVDVAINESNTDVVFRGQPLIFVAQAELENLHSKFVLPANLKLTVLRADGRSAGWSIEPLTPQVGLLELNEQTPVLGASWSVDETQTATIAEGHYVVRVEFGRFSTSHPFQVAPRPPTLSAIEQTFAAIRRAEIFVSRRQPAKALGAVNAALRVDPTNVTLLTHKAILLETAGELELAYQAAQAAQRQLHLEYPNRQEPNLVDQVTQRLRAKLLKLESKP
jgi:hypothetical protein